MVTTIVFLLILGFLVLVHELGHFLVARRNGIKADEFGLGFPPRLFGVVKDDKKNKWIFIKGSKEVISENTIYSLNWLPIGGFVKIKGENGEGKNDKDSFASKSAWIRVKVLAAGVTMNFIFAWLFFSFGFMLGTSQQVDDNTEGSSILITSVEEKSPAQEMKLVAGDIVLKTQIDETGKTIEIKTVKDLQNYITEYKGKEISLDVLRGKTEMKLNGKVRSEVEAGKGLLGVGLTQVETVKYPFFSALWQGLKETGNVIVMMGEVLAGLFMGEKGIEVAGIVGVASVTGQVIPLGIAAIMRLIAIFGLNLAIINILPFPALDGGRILFILIEKLKGSPVSQKIEQTVHTIGFMLLMLLMVVITYRDLLRLDIFAKIKGWL